MLNMMSKMLPIEMQLEKVEENLREYKILGTEQAKGELMASMILLMTGLQNENLDMSQVMQRATEDEGKMSLMDNILSDNSN